MLLFFSQAPWSHQSCKAASLLGGENALLPLSQSPHLGEEDPGQAGWSKCRQKLGSKLSLGETGTRQSSQAAASICCKSAATVKPRLFFPPRLSGVKKGERRPSVENGVRETSHPLPSPAGWRLTLLRSSMMCPPSSAGFWGGTSIPSSACPSRLPHACPQQHSSTPGLFHAPRHRRAPFGLLFGTVLETCPRLPAHPPSLHTSLVISTLSPSTTKLQLPQPVLISAMHAISRTRGQVPPESGSLNKRGALLFHHRGL